MSDPTSAWRIDARGRRNYRGCGARGRRERTQMATKTDLQDLDVAIAELAAAREMLVDAEKLDPSARDEARRTALAKIGLAGRFLDEVLRRG